jgi:hypothetical protein
MIRAIYGGTLPEVRLILSDGSDRRIKQGEQIEVSEQEWERMKGTGNFFLVNEPHADPEPAPAAAPLPDQAPEQPKGASSKKSKQPGGKR